MNNTIQNQEWEINQTINFQLQEQKKADQRGNERLFEIRQHHTKEKLGKDKILPASGDSQVSKPEKGKKVESKPTLASPAVAFAGLKGEDEGGNDGQTLGLIAIIGEVMALQAKSNSNFWSTLWNQASEGMNLEVKFAPIIGNAINSSYMAQSAATQAQADMAKEDGLINLFMFGGAMFMGAVSEVTSEADDAADPKNPNTLAKLGDDDDENERLSSDSSGNPAEQTVRQEEQTENDVTETINKENKSWKGRATRTGKIVKDVGGKAYKRLGNIFGKGMQYSMSMDALNRGITGYFVDSKYQNLKAVNEAYEGQAQALSKESEQYAQFYGQSFSRSEDLRNGAQQNIDYVMNILKSAADTISQTVTSMFQRG